VIAVPGLSFPLDVSIFLLAYTPILLFCLSGETRLPQPVQRLLETAGNTTYSCYLLHFPIQLSIAIVFALLHRPIPYDRPLFWLTFVSGTLLAAHFIYRYFEAPAQRLIRGRLLRRHGALPNDGREHPGLTGEALRNARHART